jgi:UDP-3-O-[3-hydroxymyristoyl] glucosamine N-acyltransferase
MGDGVRYTLRALAEALGAVLDGDPDVVVSGVAPLHGAGPEQISFLTDGRYREAARTSRAAAFLAPDDAGELPGPVLRSRSPKLALIELLRLFYPESSAPPGIHATAVVAADAYVDPSASVGALTVVEAQAVVRAGARIFPLVYVGRGAEIGEASVLYPHVVIRDGVRIGRRVIIHPGAVLGADGFGYAFDGAAHRKIPQVGGVIVEDDVEIGANATIDRSTIGDTVIGQGVKIDNLVQIGHNVEVGDHSVIAAQTGIAGSSRVGRGTVIGGQAGIADHVTIGDGAMLGARSAALGDLDGGQPYMGIPARPAGEARRIWAAESRLPRLLRRVLELERRLEDLERRAGAPGPPRPEPR